MSSDWRSTKLRGALMDSIDDAVHNIKVFGAPKYDSVPDFIQQACIKLLKEEGQKLKEKEVATT